MDSVPVRPNPAPITRVIPTYSIGNRPSGTDAIAEFGETFARPIAAPATLTIQERSPRVVRSRALNADIR
jgi:hypothetical protein